MIEQLSLHGLQNTSPDQRLRKDDWLRAYKDLILLWFI